MAEFPGTSSSGFSATSPTSANKDPVEEISGHQEENKKRKKPYICKFEVVQVLENPRKGRYSLKAVKPLSSTVNMSALPTVCLKEERAGDERAFHIMHNFKHKNILSMKLLSENKMKSSDALSMAAFVEPYNGALLEICGPSDCADEINHIPSPKFQQYMREIVDGIDFLIKKDLYHGNLSWDSTLRAGNIVKLAGFKLKEPSMNDDEAKWNDWLSFRKMLEVIAQRTHKDNQGSDRRRQFYCGTLDSLITMMRNLDCTSLSTMRELILQDPFFWDFTKRVRFFANTISLKLSDKDFMSRVRESDICEKSWDKNGSDQFKNLVQKMNDHREEERRKSEENRLREEGRGRARGGLFSKRWKPYDGSSKEHYLKCICGGYTHDRVIGVNVDSVVRENHPSIVIDVKRILEADNLPLGSRSS